MWAIGLIQQDGLIYVLLCRNVTQCYLVPQLHRQVQFPSLPPSSFGGHVLLVMDKHTHAPGSMCLKFGKANPLLGSTMAADFMHLHYKTIKHLCCFGFTVQVNKGTNVWFSEYCFRFKVQGKMILSLQGPDPMHQVEARNRPCSALVKSMALSQWAKFVHLDLNN